MSSVPFEEAVAQEEKYLRALYPTPKDVPTCTSMLDDFLACNRKRRPSSNQTVLTYYHYTGMRNRIVSIYRHGEMEACKPKQKEFMYCMSLTWMHPEEKRDAWIRRRAEWWAKRRLTQSSEAVWDMRT